MSVPSLREDRYYDRTYLSVDGSLILSILPAPDGFYFAYVSPAGPGVHLDHMLINSQGFGPGFSFGAGIDLPAWKEYKFLANVGVRYESVRHAESEPVQNENAVNDVRGYALTLWSAAVEFAIRRSVTESFYVQAGFASSYYLQDYFSGYRHVATISIDIPEQTSRYSYNPQRYAFTLGGGFLVPLSGQNIFAVGINAHFPLSQLYFGVTQDDYDNSKVAQVKLWSFDLTLSYNIPLGGSPRHTGEAPTE